ncbi:hypothetical protein P152DRAFT_159314 [Eremomyces bilateralis CBS 781.70]|uniref:Uncharacterized protein n=1 Tax=Eremomyces bilateralis CBS 781.70 TaxID=1392243 RepID=A0A6G1FUX6_9PEZI|nr:uncharacterized protein P152DRAFT_159314 [Eremomyces bilateralis CBS 781.70]KAF1809508.1 hypothetical protein P152DRAFT_159314 [Eremomyces bilateralis CBS 781.70]
MLTEHPARHLPRYEMRADIISPETLDVFRLPWKWHENDPGYIVILKAVPGDLLKTLVAHTASLDAAVRVPALLCDDLKDQYFAGPNNKAPYISFVVLSPTITVERLRGNIHIAARFNIEATILQYHSQKRNNHEPFSHDICLRYFSDSSNEVLVMTPESDASAAFTVTKKTTTSVNPQAGLTMSATPSANVSIGLTRSAELNVQYAVESWSVSAHRLVDEDGCSPMSKRGGCNHGPAQYQWFWAGNQEETKQLTPDLKRTLKIHVVAKRVLPYLDFPLNGPFKKSYQEILSQVTGKIRSPSDAHDEVILRALSACFTFRFCVQVRVKRRYGRLHRLLLLSSNDVKGAFLKPEFRTQFTIRPNLTWLTALIQEEKRRRPAPGPSKPPRKPDCEKKNQGKGSKGEDKPKPKDDEDTDDGRSSSNSSEGNEESEDDELPPPFRMPLAGDTIDITALLEEIKEQNGGRVDALQGQSVANILGHQRFTTLRTRERERDVLFGRTRYSNGPEQVYVRRERSPQLRTERDSGTRNRVVTRMVSPPTPNRERRIIRTTHLSDR